ncbi:hypothetical protein J7E55_26480 [Bacillus sp. ISL-53]|nr:hypothetical protein [Bacillus sp. ISL-53]
MIKQFYKRIIQLNILRACFGQSFFKTRSFFSFTKVFNINLIKLYFNIQSKKMDKLGITKLTKEKHVLFHPPYRIDSGISKSEGLVAFGVGKYTTSNEIKKVMIGLLRSIKATFEVLEKHLPLKELTN